LIETGLLDLIAIDPEGMTWIAEKREYEYKWTLACIAFQLDFVSRCRSALNMKGDTMKFERPCIVDFPKPNYGGMCCNYGRRVLGDRPSGGDTGFLRSWYDNEEHACRMMLKHGEGFTKSRPMTTERKI